MSAMARAFLAELDDEALDELAARLAPRLAGHTLAPAEAPASDAPLSVREAAHRHGVHERTIRRAIEAGTLEATKPAGRWRLQPAALAAWGAAPSPGRTPSRTRRVPRGTRGGPLAAALAERRGAS